MGMTQYQKDLVRMWDSLRSVVYEGAGSCGGVSCAKCPFDNTVCHDDNNGVLFNAEKVIEIVTQWAKEHPIVTYEQKYEETFGVKPIDPFDDILCPHFAGFVDVKCEKNTIGCKKCKEGFWNSEYKDPKKEVSDEDTCKQGA